MHKLLADKMVESIRRRVSEGDCPAEPPQSVENLEDLVLTLAALSAESVSAGTEPVAVKPLEWRDLTSSREDGPSEPTGDIEANTMIGEYSICLDEGAIEDSGPDWKWCVWTPVESLGHFGDLGEAKAAAQADYERRIRSALLPAPAAREPETDLATLMQKSRDWFNSLTPEEQEAHLRKQRESWVRGEMAIGNDADEARDRAALREPETGVSGEVGETDALAEFTAWFIRNYPGPDTIIFNPSWHAPRIFRAARYCLSASHRAHPGREEWQPIETAPVCTNVLCAVPLGPNHWLRIVAEKVPAHAGAWFADGVRLTTEPTYWQHLPSPPHSTPTSSKGGE